MSARSIFTGSGVPNYTLRPNPDAVANFMQPLVYNGNGELIYSSGARVGQSTPGLSLSFKEFQGNGECLPGVLNIMRTQMDDGRQQVTLEFRGADSLVDTSKASKVYIATIPTGWGPDPSMDIVVGYGKMEQVGVVYPSMIKCQSGIISIISPTSMAITTKTTVGAFMCTYVLAAN